MLPGLYFSRRRKGLPVPLRQKRSVSMACMDDSWRRTHRRCNDPSRRVVGLNGYPLSLPSMQANDLCLREVLRYAARQSYKGCGARNNQTVLTLFAWLLRTYSVHSPMPSRTISVRSAFRACNGRERESRRGFRHRRVPLARHCSLVVCALEPSQQLLS